MVHKIGLLGFGTVGRGLAEIILEKKQLLKDKYDVEFVITAISDFKLGNIYDPSGLDISKVLKDVEQNGKFTMHLKEWDNLAMIRESDTKTICELTYTDLNTGGPAMDHCRTAFESGKNIVTSNKGPAALAYREMKSLAEKNGVRFMIEGTVCAGTPVLNLSRGPLAGCTISAVKGILNGTTNYMLTEMEKGMAYDEVLKIAQEKGYAEADPTGDVEGHDARGKVTILANVVMEADLKIRDVSCEGITGITPEDIKRARENDSRWKLIGIVELNEGKVKASVSPQMVKLNHPLAGVPGATNALTFSTDLLGDVTIVGPGAGKKETGFSILTDLISLAT